MTYSMLTTRLGRVAGFLAQMAVLLEMQAHLRISQCRMIWGGPNVGGL